jgi:Spy/CpxP family protein refolding chaperone
MKKHVMMMMRSAVMLAASVPASATDYSRLSNDDLARMRGTMRNASAEERSAYRDEWQKRVASMRPEERQALTGKTAKGSRQCRPAPLREQLGLNDSQEKKLQQLREKQFAAMTGERRQLMNLQRQMLEESLKKNPDNRTIAMLSEKIGSAHAELALKRSAHLREMASILTPGQREKMKTFMQNRPLERSGKMAL